MRSQVSFLTLDSDDSWDQLRGAIGYSDRLPSVAQIVSLLQRNDVKFCLVEESYLDRDFSSQFSKFYSTVFRNYSKNCKRFHFFSVELDDSLTAADPKDIAILLNSTSNSTYKGYIVTRPLANAPIARAVLSLPENEKDSEIHLLVRAEYAAHLLGAELTVVGSPFTQQDARIGSCAQAAIWVCGRHFNVKHGGPWLSVPDISEAASQPADVTLAQSLPAGSGGLSLNSIVRALRAMGREPFCYSASFDPNDASSPVTWPSPLRPDEIINRYVDSGIPVILILRNWEGTSPLGHAVVAVGHELITLNTGVFLPNRPTRAAFCRYFIVVDDQRGTYLRMPIMANKEGGETPYNVNTHVINIVVPLPNKVFVRAETTEMIAWELLRYYAENCLHWFKSANITGEDSSSAVATTFLNAVAENRVIARSYLTYGWKYKARMIRNMVSSELRRLVQFQDLPKFVWITEFGTLDSLNTHEPESRRIFSHVVVDATGGNYPDSIILFHGPGVLLEWSRSPAQSSTVIAPEGITFMKWDQSYKPKTRGRLV